MVSESINKFQLFLILHYQQTKALEHRINNILFLRDYPKDINNILEITLIKRKQLPASNDFGVKLSETIPRVKWFQRVFTNSNCF
jgi:hypothetical protein